MPRSPFGQNLVDGIWEGNAVYAKMHVYQGFIMGGV
jgi:hypothetical protein